MMNFASRLPNPYVTTQGVKSHMVTYTSTKPIQSKTLPGVTFHIRKMSLDTRLRMLESLSEVSKQLDFHQAGETLHDQLQTHTLSALTESVYIRTGLEEISGITIDGQPATTESLIRCGPERLTREIAEAIRQEAFLSEEERKN